VAIEEPPNISDRPLPMKTAFPIPSMFVGNLPWSPILHLVCTGVKEIPPLPFYLCAKAIIVLAISDKGTTFSAAFCAIASLGIPKTIQDDSYSNAVC